MHCPWLLHMSAACCCRVVLWATSIVFACSIVSVQEANKHGGGVFIVPTWVYPKRVRFITMYANFAQSGNTLKGEQIDTTDRQIGSFYGGKVISCVCIHCFRLVLRRGETGGVEKCLSVRRLD